MGVFTSIKNIFRKGADDLNKALENPVRDSKYAIEDSKEMVSDLRESARSLKIQNVQLKNRKSALETKIATLQTTLTSIVEKSKTSQGTEAEEHKKKAKKVYDQITREKNQLNLVSSEITKNEEIISKNEDQISAIEQKIDSAEQNHDRLKVRLQGAKARQDLAQIQDKYSNGNSPLAELDNLEKIVEEQEAKAQVMDEEIASQSDNVVDDIVGEYSETENSNAEFEALFAK